MIHPSCRIFATPFRPGGNVLTCILAVSAFGGCGLPVVLLDGGNHFLKPGKPNAAEIERHVHQGPLPTLRPVIQAMQPEYGFQVGNGVVDIQPQKSPRF